MSYNQPRIGYIQRFIEREDAPHHTLASTQTTLDELVELGEIERMGTGPNARYRSPKLGQRWVTAAEVMNTLAEEN